MTDFTKTPGWLDWYQGPSKPKFKLPAGAIDSHCHVFGPSNIFPYSPERKYTPCDASKEQLFALRDHLGFARNIIVQATCHGADNRALVDALTHSDGKARGVATVKRDVSDAEIQRLHDAGVRGVRFNFVKRLVDFTPKDELMEIASRIKAWGWHGTSLLLCQRRWWWTTWDDPMSPSLLMDLSSSCSLNSCVSTKTSGARSLVLSV